MPKNSKETAIVKKSKEIDNVSKHLENVTILKNIYIKNNTTKKKKAVKKIRKKILLFTIK